jgi:hypothetical protein
VIENGLNESQEGLVTETEGRRSSFEMVAEEKISIWVIVKSRMFIQLYCMATCHFYFGYFWNNEYKTYGKRFINDD